MININYIIYFLAILFRFKAVLSRAISFQNINNLTERIIRINSLLLRILEFLITRKLKVIIEASLGSTLK